MPQVMLYNVLCTLKIFQEVYFHEKLFIQVLMPNLNIMVDNFDPEGCKYKKQQNYIVSLPSC
jgi:hypothetical protein